jgi:predicted nucleic acid-binding protein
MNVRVVDASALGAVVFGEPQAEEIANLFSGALLIGPTLLPFELASICMKKIKAHPANKKLIMQAFEASTKLVIEQVEVEHAEVIALAEETGLSTYDASYLWLARETGGPLVTLDVKLGKAADKEKDEAAIK